MERAKVKVMWEWTTDVELHAVDDPDMTVTLEGELEIPFVMLTVKRVQSAEIPDEIREQEGFPTAMDVEFPGSHFLSSLIVRDEDGMVLPFTVGDGREEWINAVTWPQIPMPRRFFRQTLHFDEGATPASVVATLTMLVRVYDNFGFNVVPAFSTCFLPVYWIDDAHVRDDGTITEPSEVVDYGNGQVCADLLLPILKKPLYLLRGHQHNQ